MQDEAAETRPVRPQLALRVGVTGTRDLPADQVERVERQVRDTLGLIRDHAAALAGDSRVRAAYAPDPDGVVRPALRLISPLAEGADRLVARIALELGFRLDAPMPFAHADYAGDFTAPGSRDAFEALLAHTAACAPDGRARTLELDGGSGDDESASYGAIGRLVVRNCDLLIAIWHGHPGKGGGGTADTVRFAARSGPPVWWIHSGEPPPRDPGAAVTPAEPAWIETMDELRRPYSLVRGEAAAGRLQAYLDGIIIPPKPMPPLREGVLGRLFGHSQTPLPRFYAEVLPIHRPTTGWIWQSEQRVMKVALSAGVLIEDGLEWVATGCNRTWTTIRRRTPDHDAPSRPRRARPSRTDPNAVKTEPDAHPAPAGGRAPFGYWSRIYGVTDQLASAYANRYRSSYVVVTIAAAVALLAAGLHQAWAGGGTLLALLELGSLALLLVFVVMNHQAHWHARWISYRLLAELCRKQRALSLFAWSLPVGETWRVSAGEAGGTHGRVTAAPGRDGWVGWYFHAALRAAPLPTGWLGGDALTASCLHVETTLIGTQVDYHEARSQKASWQSRGLAGWGEVCLLATAMLVLVKVAFVLFRPETGEHWISGLEIAAQIVVVFSVAFITLRIYAELELLAETSAGMATMMKATQLRLEALRTPDPATGRHPPLTSQEIGGAVHELALDMLAETEGWAQLFNVKDVEAA